MVMFLLIGLGTGVISGLFGVGGGILIVPALVYLAGFSQEKATGTSLAVLLPPVGLLAVIEYYRTGNVDLKAGLWVALGLVIGAWFGAMGAHKVSEQWMKLSFGIFMTLLGMGLIVMALKGLHSKGL
jgi:uncharacterized membrane protein YfcA